MQGDKRVRAYTLGWMANCPFCGEANTNLSTLDKYSECEVVCDTCGTRFVAVHPDGSLEEKPVEF
jgi:transcription elongation factor Elf1